MPVNSCAAGHRTFGTLRIIPLVVAILILFSVPAFAAQRITKIQAVNLVDKVQICVNATEPITFTSKSSAKGGYTTFDLKGYYMPSRPGRMATGDARIVGVRYGRFRANPAVSRIAVGTRGRVHYSTRYLNDKCTLVLDVWKTTGPVAMKRHKMNLALSMVPAAQSMPVMATPNTKSIPTRANSAPASPAISEPTVVAEATRTTTTAVEAKPIVMAEATSPVRITRRASDAPVLQAAVVTAKPAPAAVKNICLDFVGADINDVLKALSVQSGSNIVCGSDVKGQVTVSLNRVSLDEALTYVAKLSGYPYAKASEDTFVVGNNVGSITGGGAGMVTNIVALRHSTIDDMISVLAKRVPVVTISSANSLGKGPDGKELPQPAGAARLALLSGSASDVAQARVVMAEVEDSMATQGASLEDHFYKIKYMDCQQLMTMVKSLVPSIVVTAGPVTGYQLTDKEKLTVGLSGDGAGDYSFKVQPDQIVLSGSKEDIDRAIALLDKVDVKPSYVLVEAQVTDISNDDAKQLGVSYTWPEFSFSQVVPALDKLNFPIGTTKKMDHQPFGFSAMLDAMVKNGHAKILASPKISVLDGKVGNIFVGDEVKYVINISQTPQGQNVTTETALVGVQLRFIPKVNPDGYITLNIHPEVSVITSFLQVEGTSIALPQIARRFTDSTNRVKNGQTIVIGGLIRDNEIVSMQKIPLLGDLPFLGNLFRHRSVTKQHSEVVIFITAKIIED